MRIKLKNILFNIFAIITVLSVIFVGFNIVSGAKGYAVTGGSMEDTFSRGDVVFSKKVDFEELKVGDIITVSSEDGERFFTHRIVEINAKDKTVTTRGDANTVDDPMPTKADRIVGKMWYSVPVLGFISIAFSQMSQMTGIIILCVIAVVLVVANTVLTHRKKNKNIKKKSGDIDEQV